MSDAEQTMNEAMYDTDEDLMNAPIGTFDTSETSDNIVLGNKYDRYNKKEQAIKDAHQKNQEKMFKEGKLYPSMGMSPIKYGFGNPPRKDRAARLVGFRLDVGDDNSKLTKQDLREGQSNWNYRVMKLQRKKKDYDSHDEFDEAMSEGISKSKKKGGGKRRRKSRKKYKKKTRKRRRKRKKRRRTRKKNRR